MLSRQSYPVPPLWAAIGASNDNCQPPPAPSIGIEPRPSHSHAPHPLFQRLGRIASVDSGLKTSVGAARRSNGRKERTSFCIVDSRSVKNTDSAGSKGYDAGRKVSGVKRHIAVDTDGLPHGIHVTTANLTDRAGALSIFDRCRDDLSQVQTVLVDGGYTEKPFAAAVQSLLGASVEVIKQSHHQRSATIVTQGESPFQYAEDGSSTGVTALAGLASTPVPPKPLYPLSALSPSLSGGFGKAAPICALRPKGIFYENMGHMVSNAGISAFRPRSGRLAFRRVSAGPPDPGDRASIAGKDSMSFLNNLTARS